MTLHTQWITMGVMILCGLYIGIVTDTLRRLFASWQMTIILHLLCRSIYWMTQTAVLYVVLYKVNGGFLRFYLLIACLLGFSMYHALVRSAYLAFLEWVLSVMKLCTRILNRLLLRPIWLIICFCSGQLYAIVIFFLRALLYMTKLLFYPVISLWKQVYKRLPEKYNENITKFLAFCSTMGSTFILQLKRSIKRR